MRIKSVEREEPSISELGAGTIIEVADIVELASFEDEVAIDIDRRLAEAYPLLTQRLNIVRWQGRLALRELLRPPKFNGSIADIRLQVMDDPIKQLVSASQEGWNLGPGSSVISTSEATLPFWLGFDLVANATSSGRGIIGQIQTKLWYYPVPFSKSPRSAAKLYQYGNSYISETVHRRVAKPKLEKERFLELQEESKRTATALQRQAILKNRREANR